MKKHKKSITKEEMQKIESNRRKSELFKQMNGNWGYYSNVQESKKKYTRKQKHKKNWE